MQTRNNYTPAQKEQAHQTDIIDFLSQSEGFSFKKTGREYHCIEHNSFVVMSDRMGWYWNSQKVGGSDAIAYCTKIKQMTYPEALEAIIGQGAETARYVRAEPTTAPEARTLILPEKAPNTQRVFAYLNKTRCIDACIITKLMHERRLYQDSKNNAVFVGVDAQGSAKFASVRGTLTDKSYRGDCEGSDKHYSFSLDGKYKAKLFVFEAPIDLLSHATLANKIIGREDAWTAHSRLSLGGVTDVALETYLASHHDVKELVFCLDNDKAGREASAALGAKYVAKGYAVKDIPPKDKDYNEDLLDYITDKKERSTAPPERCAER